MILLNAGNIKKMFGDEVLFDNVSFNVDSGDKIGFVGANGAGKTTLFKILAGEAEYDGGEIFKNKYTKIGYLEQYSCTGGKTVLQEAETVFGEVIAVEEELEDIRFELEGGGDNIDALIARQTRLQERFLELDGAYYKSKIRGALMGLGFLEEEFSLSTDKLSGGQKTRLALGKILLSDANLLLLDEPTNYLDIDSVEWLEEFLKSCKAAFIVISHDRYFLDKVTDRTFELENNRLKCYSGGYSAYTVQKETDRKTRERSYENTVREIKRLEGIVEQQKRWNREENIKTARSKQKVIDRLERELEAPARQAEEMRFKFRACVGGGQDVLSVEGLGVAFGDNRLFKNADMLIKKGEKVFLLGPNGCGKTTLLKLIIGEYRPSEGECRLGANIHAGYYDQIQENLHSEKTIMDEVWDEYPSLTQTEIRNALAVFLFRGEDVFKEIRTLSGGERARVELVKLMLKSVNFLILDEPTNHLDIDSREALENALADYDGTLLAVSHDRYFINKLADRILYLTEDGIISFTGDYDDFLDGRGGEAPPKKETEDKGLDYREQKRAEAQKRKNANDLKKTEAKIAELEDAVSKKEKELLEAASDYVAAARITEEMSELNEQIEALMEQWEKLQIQIEEDMA